MFATCTEYELGVEVWVEVCTLRLVRGGAAPHVEKTQTVKWMDK